MYEEISVSEKITLMNELLENKGNNSNAWTLRQTIAINNPKTNVNIFFIFILLFDLRNSFSPLNKLTAIPDLNQP
jgi:hypothetical protein